MGDIASVSAAFRLTGRIPRFTRQRTAGRRHLESAPPARGGGTSKSDAASMTTIEAPKGAARRNTVWRAGVLLLTAVLAPQVASAQDKGTLNPQPLPPIAKPDDPATPAKELFGRKSAPAH